MGTLSSYRISFFPFQVLDALPEAEIGFHPLDTCEPRGWASHLIFPFIDPPLLPFFVSLPLNRQDRRAEIASYLPRIVLERYIHGIEPNSAPESSEIGCTPQSCPWYPSPHAR